MSLPHLEFYKTKHGMRVREHLTTPKNQHQQVLHYLYYWDNFSLADVIKDAMFFKFQSRLSEIESEQMKNIATRTRIKFENKFGNKSSYNTYKRCVSKEKLKELFELYN